MPFAPPAPGNPAYIPLWAAGTGAAPTKAMPNDGPPLPPAPPLPAPPNPPLPPAPPPSGHSCAQTTAATPPADDSSCRQVAAGAARTAATATRARCARRPIASLARYPGGLVETTGHERRSQRLSTALAGAAA